MLVLLLAFFIYWPIKTQARVEDTEASPLKAGKGLHPALFHFMSRHQFSTCSRSLFDWLRTSTNGGREDPGNEFDAKSLVATWVVTRW